MAEKPVEKPIAEKLEEVKSVPIINRELVEDYTSNAQVNQETHDLTNKIVEQALDRTI